MEATRWNITARKREVPLSITDPSDFELDQPQGMDARLVLSNPSISLYCLDRANRRAFFVETPPQVDLSAAPFMYLAQFEKALSVISAPYETLHELAESLPFDSARLILIHSVGRCGSTLVSSALNAVPGVLGLSEPDVFSQLVGVRGWDRENEAETSALIKTCIRLQCKPSIQNPHPVAWVIKFRSFCIELADLLFEHFPDAKNIFLYRNAETQIASALRAYVPPGWDTEDIRFRGYMQAMETGPTIAKYNKSGGPVLGAGVIGAMTWLRVMEIYTEMVGKGMGGMAVRYEDLKTNPREAARAIIAYCGFPEADMQAVYSVLEKDSQAGSPAAQEKLAGKNHGLSQVQKADIERVLAGHATIQSPGFIVPGTWQRPGTF
jgi:hypothetical protein